MLWEPLDDVLGQGDLRLGEEDGGRVLRYHDHVFPVAAGTWDGDEADVAAVLARQHYVLAGWRERDEVLNYRRFFDVDGLVAVRVEVPDVFDATHRVLLDLNHRGIVEGFRIDHPDGLADPEGYLDRLRVRAAARAPRSGWRRSSRGRSGCRTGPATAPPATTPPGDHRRAGRPDHGAGAAARLGGHRR